MIEGLYLPQIESPGNQLKEKAKEAFSQARNAVADLINNDPIRKLEVATTAAIVSGSIGLTLLTGEPSYMTASLLAFPSIIFGESVLRPLSQIPEKIRTQNSR